MIESTLRFDDVHVKVIQILLLLLWAVQENGVGDSLGMRLNFKLSVHTHPLRVNFCDVLFTML